MREYPKDFFLNTNRWIQTSGLSRETKHKILLNALTLRRNVKLQNSKNHFIMRNRVPCKLPLSKFNYRIMEWSVEDQWIVKFQHGIRDERPHLHRERKLALKRTNFYDRGAAMDPGSHEAFT